MFTGRRIAALLALVFVFAAWFPSPEPWPGTPAPEKPIGYPTPGPEADIESKGWQRAYLPMIGGF